MNILQKQVFAPENCTLLEILILEILHSEPQYGYHIIKKVKLEICDVKDGSVYCSLHKFLEKGWLDYFLTESKDGPARKYYRLTNFGEKMYVSLRNRIISILSIS